MKTPITVFCIISACLICLLVFSCNGHKNRIITDVRPLPSGECLYIVNDSTKYNFIDEPGAYHKGEIFEVGTKK